MTSASKSWSYSTGERGRNRVRAFEDQKSGIIFLEFYDRRQERGISLMAKRGSGSIQFLQEANAASGNGR